MGFVLFEFFIHSSAVCFLFLVVSFSKSSMDVWLLVAPDSGGPDCRLWAFVEGVAPMKLSFLVSTLKLCLHAAPQCPGVLFQLPLLLGPFTYFIDTSLMYRTLGYKPWSGEGKWVWTSLHGKALCIFRPSQPSSWFLSGSQAPPSPLDFPLCAGIPRPSPKLSFLFSRQGCSCP